MKSLMTLLQLVLSDLGARCGTSTTLDFKTIQSRYEHESLSFLTITMPKFGKDFEKSLDQGFVGHDQFAGFRRSGGLPRFLGGFLDLVFDRGSARLLEFPSQDAIFAIRQITLMYKKIEVACAPHRRTAAFANYLQVEQDIRLTDKELISSKSDLIRSFERIGSLLWAEFFSAVDGRIYNDAVVPKHGPGATADKLRGNAKYNQPSWTRRLEEVFPSWVYLIPNPRPIFMEWVDEVKILDPRDEIAVKVISVPKTLKTPRIIAVEPTGMQYMQQGVLSVMMEEIPSFNQTRNFVMFERQEPNQRLALEGSLSGALATLDLSEASDRVSNQHVRSLLRNHRHLRHAVDATRSRKADVPCEFDREGTPIKYRTIRLAKFASMGSALCFPFEAMVFITIMFVGIEKSLSRHLTMKDIESFYGRVRAYGDDLIVPVEHVLPVIEALEAFGLKVNRDKSFWTGKFRESCGKDYYAGKDVTVTYVRRNLPRNRLQARELVSTVALRNQLYHAGFETAVDWLDDRIRKLIPFPIVEPTSTLLGRWDWGPYESQYTHPHLHTPMVKGAMMVATPRVSKLDGVGALQKFLLRANQMEGVRLSWGGTAIPRDDDPYEGIIHPSLRVQEWQPWLRNQPWNIDFATSGEDHLRFAGRPDSVRIKIGSAPPY